MRRHASGPQRTYAAAEREIARPENLVTAHFRLNEGAPASATLDLTLATPSCATALAGIHIDIMTLARNDFGAISYPLCASELFDEATAAAMTTFLMPHLHLLTRGRVVPLDILLRFAPESS